MFSTNRKFSPKMDRRIVQALQSTIQSSPLQIIILPKKMLINHLSKVSKAQEKLWMMKIHQRNLSQKIRIKSQTTTLLRRGADHYCLYPQSSQKMTTKGIFDIYNFFDTPFSTPYLCFENLSLTLDKNCKDNDISLSVVEIM